MATELRDAINQGLNSLPFSSEEERENERTRLLGQLTRMILRDEMHDQLVELAHGKMVDLHPIDKAKAVAWDAVCEEYDAEMSPDTEASVLLEVHRQIHLINAKFPQPTGKGE